jgi:hypothetical protein
MQIENLGMSLRNVNAQRLVAFVTAHKKTLTWATDESHPSQGVLLA